MGRKNLKFFLSIFFFLYFSKYALSEKSYISRNLYGERGILEVPVAGPLDDGSISFSSTSVGAITQNTISFQALPRVYGALRYTGVGNTSSQAYLAGSGYSYWDRSFDLRIDLLKENILLPDISLGMQDIVGGGSFSSEYLVASKSLFGNLRLSAGLGWGMLSSNTISTFGTRSTQENEQGGNLKYKHLFRGDIGVFGGFEYLTPVKNLKFKFEYSSNSREK